MKDTVGVLITSFNQEALLKQAIDSVLNQSVRPDKLVIVDDGSEDGSRGLIESYQNNYPGIIEATYHERNMGITKTRYDGLSKMNTRLVTYLDGDDLFSEEKLKKELVAITREGTAIVHSDSYYIDRQNKIIGRWAGDTFIPEGDVFVETFSRDYPGRNLFRMEMVDHSAWSKIGFHDLNLSIYEDFDMRIRLTKQYRTSHVSEPLSSVRLNTDGLSKKPPRDHVIALHYIYRKNRHLLDDLESRDARFCRKKYAEWILGAIRAASKQAWDHNELADYVTMQIRRLQYTATALWNRK